MSSTVTGCQGVEKEKEKEKEKGIIIEYNN